LRAGRTFAPTKPTAAWARLRTLGRPLGSRLPRTSVGALGSPLVSVARLSLSFDCARPRCVRLSRTCGSPIFSAWRLRQAVAAVHVVHSPAGRPAADSEGP